MPLANMRIIVFCAIASFLSLGHAQKCAPRKFDEDSVVCVCNSTYCDSVEVNVPERGQFSSYLSSKTGDRLEPNEGSFGDTESGEIKLLLNLEKTYQEVLGFGGAFTDSAGLNIKSLSEEAQEQLMQAYFGPKGSRYNFGRVPVGGTDFSTRAYTLDDVPSDTRLSNFSLAPEDYNYKIPYMKRALELSPDLKFVAAAWTAPPWMKTNNNYYGFLGFLKEEYYQTYANYLIKFLEGYENASLPIWAISTGNEPENAFLPFVRISSLGWTPSSVTKWVIENFGPAIEASNSNNTLILAIDDQRWLLPWSVDRMYRTNATIDKYLAGIAVHWYGDKVTPASLFDLTHRKYPDKFLLMTEACEGSEILTLKHVRLGHWGRAERYARSIIQDLNHWVTGWIDWNLALDTTGGPTWIDNNVDSSIIVNPETDEFFKQPMFYSIAHFSKFVPRGSVRIDLTRSKSIESIAFLTPSDEVVIVLFNGHNDDRQVSIVDPQQGTINVEMPKHSIRTIIYQK